jgi:hypothetical protein
MNGWCQSSLAIGTAALLGFSMQGLAAEGSVSSQSPLSRQQAWQEAMSQLPKGARVTSSNCNDVEIGYGNTRYYCVLTFTQPDPAEAEHKKAAAQD